MQIQEDSVRRLSQPVSRLTSLSSSPKESLLTLRPNFWQFATPKSIENVVALLRKQNRARDLDGAWQEFLVAKPPDETKAETMAVSYFGLKCVEPFRRSRIRAGMKVKGNAPERPGVALRPFPTVQVLKAASRSKTSSKESVEEQGKEQGPKDWVKRYKELQKAILRDEEYNNIIHMKATSVRNLVLSPKYLPGRGMCSLEGRNFIEELKIKLRKLQAMHQLSRLTKNGEKKLIKRLATPDKRRNRRFVQTKSKPKKQGKRK